MRRKSRREGDERVAFSHLKKTKSPGNEVENGLSEKSRSLTAFMTDDGVKRYKCLIFGISKASEIFQRCLEQKLRDLT